MGSYQSVYLPLSAAIACIPSQYNSSSLLTQPWKFHIHSLLLNQRPLQATN